MTSSAPSPAPVQWNGDAMEETLLSVTMSSLMRLTTNEPPFSPLAEYVQSQRAETPGMSSPALSHASEDSLDSILTSVSTNNSVAEDMNSLVVTEDEAETNQLIYRLCSSLYKKALQKTEGRNARRSTPVPVDTRHELNMSRVMDWMPLLHLFDPKSFYAYRDTGFSGAAAGAEVPVGLQRAANPREASRRLLDELDVAKLSGGNSNHVYRLCHPHFPEKVILLRVYGGGDDEAIDRYRDVAAMKQMSKARLSPAVLHTFKWGRVEEFMDNVATGTTDMMIASAPLFSEVYTVLNEMHQLPAEPFFPQAANKARFKNNALLTATLGETYDGPADYLAKNSQRLVQALSSGNTSTYYATETEVKIMEEICPTAFERASLRFLRLTSPSIRESYRGDFVRYITGEIMQVRAFLQRFSTPTVFSHNDLNPANILLSWRKVPSKFKPVFTPNTFDRERDDGSTGDRTPAAEGVAVDDDDDEVTSVVSNRSSLISRKFLTKKGRHRNLVELKGIVFIDFEYSDANYRAIDLGNTICELDYDYSRGTEDDGPGFIKYLHTFPPPGLESQWADKPVYYPRLPELIYMAWEQQQRKEDDKEGVSLGVGASCLQAVSAYFCVDEARGRGNSVLSAVALAASGRAPLVTREQLTEVFLGMLATQLHWSLWSFTLACNPDTLTNQTDGDDIFAKGSSGLDYVRYGDCRLKEYLYLKTWMSERGLI